MAKPKEALFCLGERERCVRRGREKGRGGQGLTSSDPPGIGGPALSTSSGEGASWQLPVWSLPPSQQLWVALLVFWLGREHLQAGVAPVPFPGVLWAQRRFKRVLCVGMREKPSAGAWHQEVLAHTLDAALARTLGKGGCRGAEGRAFADGGPPCVPTESPAGQGTMSRRVSRRPGL